MEVNSGPASPKSATAFRSDHPWRRYLLTAARGFLSIGVVVLISGAFRQMGLPPEKTGIPLRYPGAITSNFDASKCPFVAREVTLTPYQAGADYLS